MEILFDETVNKRSVVHRIVYCVDSETPTQRLDGICSVVRFLDKTNNSWFLNGFFKLKDGLDIKSFERKNGCRALTRQELTHKAVEILVRKHSRAYFTDENANIIRGYVFLCPLGRHSLEYLPFTPNEKEKQRVQDWKDNVHRKYNMVMVWMRLFPCLDSDCSRIICGFV